MRLVITEKPSVARDLARTLGVKGKHRGWIEGQGLGITWCIGHLVELEEPAHYNEAWRRWSLQALPMIPERFALRARKNVKDQWAVVRRLLRSHDVSEVINACDAGREGELIFRYIYDLAECKKPVRRLWVSSLTDEAIREAWGKLLPGERFDPLADAARCRSEADWLVGLNATRAMTCLARKAGGDQVLSVGRVQTPTLSMVVERDLEISDFKAKSFWQVFARFNAEVKEEQVEWEGKWFQPLKAEDRPKPQKGKKNQLPEEPDDRLKTKAEAEAIRAAVQGRVGRISRATRRRKTEQPPLLYDLTSLQRRANQRYGFPAKKTLDVAQALYEKRKLITYPRTDARYITPDQAPKLSGILEKLERVEQYHPFASDLRSKPIKPGKRVVNAAEVGDHHAILPTSKVPRLDSLSEDERLIYDLIARRLMAALSKPALFDLTTLVVDVGKQTDGLKLPEEITTPLRFQTKGRVCRQEGWQAVDPPGKSRDVELPAVERGQSAKVARSRTSEGKTRPPRPHNDATILRSMETAGRELDDKDLKRALRGAGLGTPATRANILQTLIDRGFAERKGKDLRSTAMGRALIAGIPVDELKSAALTGRWEARLSNMAEKKEQRSTFMKDVAANLTQLVEQLRNAELPKAAVVALGTGKGRRGGKQRTLPTGPPIGECPICKTKVHENPAAYSCEKGRDCSFVVFKEVARRPISLKEVEVLLSGKQTALLDGFTSKAGRSFSAHLNLDENGKAVFVFPPRDGSAFVKVATPVGEVCPMCEAGRLIRGRAAWGCGRWRAGCTFRLSFEKDGQALTNDEAIAALNAMRKDAANDSAA